MQDVVHLMTLVLSSMGLTVLVVWPQEGLGGVTGEKIFRPAVPPVPLRHVLDCYVCLSF